MAYVYKHTRGDKNEVFYIGIGTRENRINSHGNRNKHWHNVVNKHGYTVEIFADNLCWEQAWQLEIMLITRYGRRDRNLGSLVNMTDGGEGIQGHHHCDSTRLKMSKHKVKIKNSLDKLDNLTNIAKLIHTHTIKELSNLVGVSIHTIREYKKIHNITEPSIPCKDQRKLGWKLVVQMNTGKRKCDDIENLTELLEQHGITETSKLLNISFATIKSYCEENKIVYEKRHSSTTRKKRKFDKNELIELLSKYSINHISKILKTHRDVIYRFCDQNDIEVKQRKIKK